MAAHLTTLAERVVAGIERCGIPACPNGAVASRRLFMRSVGRWRSVARSWLDDPDQEKALILVSVLIDGRGVYPADAGDPLADVFADAPRHPKLLRKLGLFALSHRPPTGFLREFVLEHDGERRGTLDIKRGGLVPVVDIARWAAMSAGVTAGSTATRLTAAGRAGTLDAGDGGNTDGRPAAVHRPAHGASGGGATPGPASGRRDRPAAAGAARHAGT